MSGLALGLRGHQLGLAIAVAMVVACGSAGAPAIVPSSASPSAVASAAAAATEPQPVPGAVVLTGILLQPGLLTLTDLKKLPAESQQVTFLAAGKPEQHAFKGTRLLNVLMAAKPQFDASAKNSKLRTFVLVTAGDKYMSIVAWGEIDADFGNAPILLAWEQDGKAFTDAEGPRLVVPGDKFGGRYVGGIVRIELKDGGAS